MLDPLHLRAGRQEAVQMAAPAGGVLPGTVAARRGGVQHRLDALADPAGGFRLRRPDRLQHPEHKPGVDLLDRQGADDRVDVGFQGIAPLVAVLGVAPACLVRPDVGLGRSLEGDLLGRLDPLSGPLAVAGADGVNPRRSQPAGFCGPRAGF